MEGIKEAYEKVSQIKPPTTFEQQIEIFRSRNLIIEDEKEAIEFLKRVNYYRLTGYTLTLKKNDRFFDGVTFNDIRHLYEFDKKLRNLLLEVLEDIEISFRTHIAYHHAHNYGPLGYLDSKNFENESHHASFLEELKKSINKRNDELFIRHYKEKYHNEYPIWVALETVPMGCLSKLFMNLKREDKQFISNNYYNVKYFYVESWLHCLSYVRNICAHYSRLYNKRLVITPKLHRKEKRLLESNDKIFAVIIVMKRLCLNKVLWKNFVRKLSELMEAYNDVVDLKEIGFLNNWQEILNA